MQYINFKDQEDRAAYRQYVAGLEKRELLDKKTTWVFWDAEVSQDKLLTDAKPQVLSVRNGKVPVGHFFGDFVRRLEELKQKFPEKAAVLEFREKQKPQVVLDTTQNIRKQMASSKDPARKSAIDFKALFWGLGLIGLEIPLTQTNSGFVVWMKANIHTWKSIAVSKPKLLDSKAAKNSRLSLEERIALDRQRMNAAIFGKPVLSAK